MKALLTALKSHRNLCFLDLEGTQFSHEMISIGAIHVIVDKKGNVKKIKKGYKALVKAKNRIGKVVEDLTGINDKLLKEKGITFRKAIQGLKDYLGSSYKKTLFITYGDHDRRIISQSLQYNLDANDEETKVILANHFNLDGFINNYVRDDNYNTYSLTNLLRLFSVDFKGIAHDALDDAYNLILLYEAILKNKDILCLQYEKTLSKYRHLPYPIDKVIKDLSAGKEVTPEKYKKYIKEAVE